MFLSGKENQDESLFTGGSTKSDGSEESAYIDCKSFVWAARMSLVITIVACN